MIPSLQAFMAKFLCIIATVRGFIRWQKLDHIVRLYKLIKAAVQEYSSQSRDNHDSSS